MIFRRTTLVLGAGASMHLGYPLGWELLRNLRQAIRSPGPLPAKWSADDAKEFLQRLAHYDPDSIDEFLEAERDFVPIGKYMIAQQLKQHEGRQAFNERPGWYRTLWKALLTPDNEPAFAESNLRIITFNYDRSIEFYLHYRLVGRFQCSDDEAVELVSEVPIVHLHGMMGDYPDVAYSTEHDPDRLLEISNGLRVVHQLQDDPDHFATGDFRTAHRHLEWAERIIFLGFGWHRDNIRRLRFFSPDSPAENVGGTAVVRGKIARAALMKRLISEGVVKKHDQLRNHNCEEYFMHSESLAD